jgi:hypothetical protein
MAGVTIIIDHHTLEIITVLGLVLGVIGGLYLTYDLLGRAQGILRWFIRISTPAFIGAVLLGVAGGVVYAVVYPDFDVGYGALLYGSIGCLIGAFNGLFVNPSAQPRFPFSLVHAVVGSITAYALILASDLPLVLALHRPSYFAFEAAGVAALAGGLAGGFWRFINRASSPGATKITLFSWRGAVIGLIAAGIFGFVAVFAVDYTFGVPANLSLIGALYTLVFIVPMGALIGGLSRYIFWQVDSLPGYRLGAFGVILTLIGFLVQLIDPLVLLLDIPVK